MEPAPLQRCCLDLTFLRLLRDCRTNAMRSRAISHMAKQAKDIQEAVIDEMRDCNRNMGLASDDHARWNRRTHHRGASPDGANKDDDAGLDAIQRQEEQCFEAARLAIERCDQFCQENIEECAKWWQHSTSRLLKMLVWFLNQCHPSPSTRWTKAQREMVASRLRKVDRLAKETHGLIREARITHDEARQERHFLETEIRSLRQRRTLWLPLENIIINLGGVRRDR
ncbi:hypothetical protein ml_267 [Mollivirus sibericum]|uniref:hypothetical protein n=1 Tax=Mollivirus sibericum TaxID=1678078 RepID=UPI0006B2E71A|nr:hypothetical protein ml_267 [Mollivirus sibericum]ALD62069.1 hypothetical protein ml_267 [Mollivirus sibericum]